MSFSFFARVRALTAGAIGVVALPLSLTAELVLDWGSTWEYTFADPTADPAWNRTLGGWTTGPAPFSSRVSGDFKWATYWTPDNFNYDDDLWVRTSVDLTGLDLSTIAYSFGVDNGYKLYVNGYFVSEDNAEEYAARNEYMGNIPPIYLNSGVNIIAFALEDHGGNTAFDLRLTGETLGEGGSSGSAGRLANISSRGYVGTGDNAMIAGFVIAGNAPRQVLIRGIGASLGQFGLEDVLADARLELYQGDTKIEENDDWGDAANAENIVTKGGEVGAFGVDANSTDAAMLVTLEPGNYTARLSGVGNTDGVALVEVYNAGSATSGPRLVNISTRGVVGDDSEMLIAGFVITPGASKRILLRAVGPGLNQFGVSDTVDPELRLLRGDTIIAANDDWSGAADIVTAAASAGAFALEAGSKDACLFLTLPPGNYTAHVSGKNGANGVALVEVYEVP